MGSHAGLFPTCQSKPSRQVWLQLPARAPSSQLRLEARGSQLTLLHSELAVEDDVEGERLRLALRLHHRRDPLESCGDREDLLLRLLARLVESLERLDRPELDLLL